MWIETLMMLMSVSLAVLQSISNENELNQSPTSETVSSNQQSDSTPIQESPLGSIDVFNYTLDSLNFILSSLNEFNTHYLSTITENLTSTYLYLLNHIIAFIPTKSLNREANMFTSRIKWSAFSYRMYEFQSVLFRAETFAVLCIIFIATLFVHSLFSYRERRYGIERHLNYSTSPLSTNTPDPDHFVSKVLRCINFTIFFTSFFALVNSAMKLFRTTEAFTIQLNYGQAAVYAMRGRRPNMEDCFSLKNDISKELGIEYYGVFDGHGGPNAAQYAEKEIFDAVTKRIKLLINNNKTDITLNSDSKKDVKTCSRSLPTSPVSKTSFSPSLCSSSNDNLKCPTNEFSSITMSTLKNIISEEVINVDKQLVSLFQKKSDISGTTALVVVRIVHSNTLVVANVGDSRAILCDWKGATIPLSFDHKPYQFKEYRRIVEAGGYISFKGVYRVNGILAVSRALGDYPLKEGRLVIPDPDILSFDLNELKPRFMIMASDGFWDTFSNDNAIMFVKIELLRFVNCYKDNSISNTALQIAKKLANEAYTRESYDNITVIVVLFDENGKSSIGRATPTICR